MSGEAGTLITGLNNVQQGATNLGNVAKGKGSTVQPASTPTSSNYTSNTGQWYDNPNWRQQAYGNPVANPYQVPQQAYQAQLTNTYYGQPSPTMYGNTNLYSQSNQAFQNPYNPSYTPQNGYQPYYSQPVQNAYGGQFGSIK